MHLVTCLAIHSHFGTTETPPYLNMATIAFTEILRTHVDIIKAMLMTDEFCRAYATTSKTTRAAVSKLEYRWAALSFECLQMHLADEIIEAQESGDEDWLDNWYRNEELHYNNWTRSSSSGYDFDPHREAHERQQQARRNFGAPSSSSDDS